MDSVQLQKSFIEAICSSETSVDTQRITRRYIPRDDTLHNYRGENLKSYSPLESRNCRLCGYTSTSVYVCLS
jgi:hypothetical protein